jgi:hypothetical protein
MGRSGLGVVRPTLKYLRQIRVSRWRGLITVTPISFTRHRFPADVSRQLVWLYFRFSLSVRDVAGLLAQRGIDVSDETTRC